MNPVNLSIHADALKAGKDLVTTIEGAVSNSIGYMCQIQNTAEKVTRFTIKITSDKLEKLYDRLCDTGLHMHDNASHVISNAATQYSEFRDIFVMLHINQVS